MNEWSWLTVTHNAVGVTLRIFLPEGWPFNVSKTSSSTFSGKARSLNLDETINFLEASVEEKRGAAIVMSSKDFAAIRSSLEALCKIGKVKCKKKHKKAIKNMKKVIINE